MKRYIGLLLAVALLWSGYWVVQRQALRAELTGWFDARQAEGWTASYDDIAIRGFPSRLDVTITAPVLFDPQTGLGWTAPFVQILGLSYQRDHVILAFADSQQLTLPDGAVQITSNGLRASLVTEGDAILRLNAEAESLTIGDGVALAHPLMNFHHMASADYRLSLSAAAVATGDTSGDGLTVQALVGFDAPWTLQALDGQRPQPVTLDIARADYRHDALEVALAGQVTADAEGRMSGEVTLRAQNWQALLDQAETAGTLPDTMAKPLRDALTLVASLSGRQDTLDLPLRLSRGAVSVGILPIGQAPRLRLP